MDVLILLDKLDDLIYSSKPIPLTDQVRVEREEAYSLLDQIRLSMPEEIKRARVMMKERQDEGRREKAAPAAPPDTPESPHLQEIVDSIDELKRSQRPAPPPLTAAAAEKVRSIVEAAEASAADIRAEAEREGRRIEAEATRQGMEMRKRSAAEAAARLKRADEVTAALLSEAASANSHIEEILDSVRGPAAALADVLGEGAGKVQTDFGRMRARVSEAPVGPSWDEPVDPQGEIVARRETAPEVESPAGPDSSEPERQPGDEREPESVSQSTEEWSYEEGVLDEGVEQEGADHASLPGTGPQVRAARFHTQPHDGASDESDSKLSRTRP